MSLPSVLLVGAGNLGFRYFQGLLNCEQKMQITVVDPSPKAIHKIKEFLDDNVPVTDYQINFKESLSRLSGFHDIVYLVTPAKNRFDQLYEISKNCNVGSWVIEKVLAQNAEQCDLIENLLVNYARVWVNTPRRLMAWHQRFKSRLNSSSSKILNVNIDGGNWGLACNAIHYIDLVAWWLDEDSIISINTDCLFDWKPCKRAGFFEVYGSISVTFSGGTVLTLNCDKTDRSKLITVNTSDDRWVIQEAFGTARNLQDEKIDGSIEYQSSLTPTMTNKILGCGECALPPLSVSANQHRPFLRGLLSHWNKYFNVTDSLLPIT